MSDLPRTTFVVRGETFTTCLVRELEVLREMDSIPYSVLIGVAEDSPWYGVAQAELTRRLGEIR